MISLSYWEISPKLQRTLEFFLSKLKDIITFVLKLSSSCANLSQGPSPSDQGGFKLSASFFALMWHVLTNLIYHLFIFIYHGSLQYAFNPIVLLSRQHMTENGIFSEFQKTKHVEPRAFSQKASKPSRNELWLGYISCQIIIRFQLCIYVESSKPNKSKS